MTKKGNYMADRFDIGDIITMKKPHPCGSKEREVLRVRTSDHGCPQISRKKHETNRKKDLKLKKTYGIINNCDILSD